MEYIRCLNCNNNIPDDSVFCPFCGANIVELNERAAREQATLANSVNNDVYVNMSNNIEALLKRAFLFLEDGEFDRADAYLENILDQDPENAWAYVGKLMIDLKIRVYEDLKNAKETFENNRNYIKALRFGDFNLQNGLERHKYEAIKNVKFREEQKALESTYKEACDAMETAYTFYLYTVAAEKFEKIKDYKDSALLAQECRKSAEIEKNNMEKDKDKENLKLALVVSLSITLIIIAIVWGSLA